LVFSPQSLKYQVKTPDMCRALNIRWKHLICAEIKS